MRELIVGTKLAKDVFTYLVKANAERPITLQIDGALGSDVIAVTGAGPNADDKLLGSELVTAWTNYSSSYETFTASGADISSAIESAGGGSAVSNTMAFVADANYEISVDVTGVSGDLPMLSTGTATDPASGDLAAVQLVEGVNTIKFKFETTGETFLWLANDTDGSWGATVSLKKIGINGDETVLYDSAGNVLQFAATTPIITFYAPIRLAITKPATTNTVGLMEIGVR